MVQNLVVLVGHVGKDPETHTFDGGGMVVKFSLATNERFKDKNGEYQDKTEWHQIVGFNKVAENVAKLVKKGSHLAIQGKLSYRDYTDASGIKRYFTEIVIQNWQKLDRSQGGNDFAETVGYMPSPDDAPI